MDLAELQRLMDELYGAADTERGIPSTVAWLCEELGELAQAVVPAGVVQAANPIGGWALMGCTVAPGFDFRFGAEGAA